MSLKRLINREIEVRRERIRGTVMTELRQLNFDPVGVQFPTYVVDVDVGSDRIMQNVPVKTAGSRGRFYARPGFPVFLDKDAQGRYQVVAAGDRKVSSGNLILINEETDVTTTGANIGFTQTREPFEFYEGDTPESLFDPALDGDNILWYRTYERSLGLPQNIVVESDVDGSPVLIILDKSGSSRNAVTQDANTAAYRKFDAGNPNLRSSADFDGSNDDMPITLQVPGTTLSIFAMVNKDATGAGDDVILQTEEYRIQSRAGGDRWGVEGTTQLQAPNVALTASFTLLEAIFTDPTTVSLFRDGAFEASGSVTAGSGHPGSVLGSNDAGTETHNGRIAEILVLDRAVNSSDRVAIEAYFNRSFFVGFSRWNNGVDGFPKIRVLDANGNEVVL